MRELKKKQIKEYIRSCVKKQLQEALYLVKVEFTHGRPKTKSYKIRARGENEAIQKVRKILGTIHPGGPYPEKFSKPKVIEESVQKKLYNLQNT